MGGDPRYRRAVHAAFALSNRLFRDSPVCHSHPPRCFEYRGRRFGLCARCTGLGVGWVVSLLAVAAGVEATGRGAFVAGLCLVAPMAVDGVTQTFGDRTSTNAVRFVTGLAAALGVSVMVTVPGPPL